MSQRPAVEETRISPGRCCCFTSSFRNAFSRLSSRWTRDGLRKLSKPKCQVLHRRSSAARGKRPRSRTWRPECLRTGLFAGFESRTQTCGQTNAEARGTESETARCANKEEEEVEEGKERRPFPFCPFCVEAKKKKNFPTGFCPLALSHVLTSTTEPLLCVGPTRPRRF